MRAVCLPLRLLQDHVVCVLEEDPLISLHFLRVCSLQMCRGQRGATLSDPDVSRCRLQRMPAAQNLLGSPSRSSGQTHFHILWMFGKNKMCVWWEGGGSFQRFFFSISSCVNVSLLCSCTLRQSQPLEQFSAYKKTCFDSLFRFRTCEFKLDGIRPYPWTSCPASASPRLPLV